MTSPKVNPRTISKTKKRRSVETSTEPKLLSPVPRHESALNNRTNYPNPPSEGSLFDISVPRSSAQPPDEDLHSNEPQTIVHRCRFVDYTPGSITALACTPTTWNSSLHFGFPEPGSENRGVIAVGRGNGDVEIWAWLSDGPNIKQAHKRIGNHQSWVLFRTLPGHRPSASSSSQAGSSSQVASKIEQLVFAHQITPLEEDEDEDEEGKQTSHQELLRTLPRLFGSNGGEEVLEWEWEGNQAGIIKRTLPMPPSVAIWSLAVCPRSTTLAIGCDDGTIRLACIGDDQFELIRKFDPCKSRLLSIAWGSVISRKRNRNRENGHVKGLSSDPNAFLVSGCADSSLRKWGVSTGRCIGRMTVDKLQGQQTLIWSVATVAKFIISGDSMGNINFWDSKTCARLQTIRAHRADVLCLVVSADGNEVFTSGVDQKTCQLSLTYQGSEDQPDFSKWIMCASRRLHSHDVRALAMSPPYTPSPLPPLPADNLFSSKQAPVLISGGLDMTLVLCPAASQTAGFISRQLGDADPPPNPISDSSSLWFGDSMHRKISYVTRRTPVVQLSTGGRLLVCRKDRGITIWRLRSRSPSKFPPSRLNGMKDVEENPNEAWRQVVEMDLKFHTNLVASAISPDGRWLAVSDLYEVKLFSLQWVGEGDLQPRRVKTFAPFDPDTPNPSQQGASVIQFSPDSTRLILATALTTQIIVMGVDADPRKGFQVLRTFHQHCTHPNTHHPDRRAVISPPTTTISASTQDDLREEHSSDHRRGNDSGSTISAMAISWDCQWLASVDSAQALHVFNLDLLKHHCQLPTSPLLVNCMKFCPTTPSTLILGLANNTLQVMNVETRKIPEWAHLLCSSPPTALIQQRDSMMGISFEPHSAGERDVGGSSSRTPSISSETRSPLVHTILIWGASWTCKLTLPDQPSRRPKRPRRVTDLIETDPMVTVLEQMKFKIQISHKYQPILLLEFVAHEELVVVERPFFGLLAHLPPAWLRTGAYGT